MRKLLFVLVIGTAGVSPALAQQAPPPSPAQATQIPQTAPPAAPTQTPAPSGQRGGRGQGTPGAMAGFNDFRIQGIPNPAVNVKLELSITDTYAGTPAKKTVTMLVSNGGSGMIRTSNRLPDGSPVNLNVDCQVSVSSVALPGRERGPEVIRTSLTFLYTPAQASSGEGRPAPRPADLTESVNVLLQDGKLTVVSQSADPATDRKVTVEVTATIIR
jgi:hypothetical protein